MFLFINETLNRLISNSFKNDFQYVTTTIHRYEAHLITPIFDHFLQYFWPYFNSGLVKIDPQSVFAERGRKRPPPWTLPTHGFFLAPLP